MHKAIWLLGLMLAMVTLSSRAVVPETGLYYNPEFPGSG